MGMSIQVEDEVFENLDKNKKSSKTECDTSSVKMGSPNEEKDAESNKARQGISFWEEKLAKPKISLKTDSTSKYEKEKLSKDSKVFETTCPKPKPTPRNTKKPLPTKCDNGSAF